MTHSDDLVDRIVRGVLDSLQPSAVAVRSSVPSTPAPSLEMVRSAVASTLPRVAATVPATAPAVASHELSLADAVVTGPALEEVWKNQTSVRVATKAVLTPSAREFLKKRKIDVVRGENRPTGGSSTAALPASPTAAKVVGADATPAARWRVFVVQTHAQLDRVLEDVSRGGSAKFERALPGSVVEATTAAVGALTRAEIAGGVLLTHQILVAACRANRHAKIRAAAVASVAEVNAARRQLGPNLYCIDPAAKSYFEMRNLLKAAVADRTPSAPAGWAE